MKIMHKVSGLSYFFLELVYSTQCWSSGFHYASYGVSAVHLEGGSTPCEFSHSVLSYCFLPHGLHIRLSCTSATPGSVQIHVHGVGDAIQPCHLALTFGVWECAAGPLPCVPNYMHLEYVSSLS